MKNVLITSLCLFAASCTAPTQGTEEKPAASASAPVSASSLAVEQAVRDLDLGRDPAAAKQKLEDALRDPTLPEPTKDVAHLAFARALDRTGDKEQAIRTLEAMLAKHADEHPWALEDQVDELLQKLVTGAVHHPRAERDVKPANVAFALAKFFPAKDGKTTIRQFFVGESGAAERLGTFEISEALRAKKREACPLCDDKLDAHTYSSRSSTWTRIAADRAKYDDALVVFYFDLGERRIPARYDDVLPMSVADVTARLEKGEGVVAVKQREGAPPMILLAAPRDAQLADVEEAFANMKELPSAPATVTLNAALRPNEVKSVMRGSRAAYRACADTLFAKSPGAAGTLTLKFRILGDGSIKELTVDATGGLNDAAFVQCAEKATNALAFPKSGTETNVTYPLAISPG
jgi:hypothetical protein